jgi:hypothetical protein
MSTYHDDFWSPAASGYDQGVFYHETWHIFEMNRGIESLPSLLFNQISSKLNGSNPYAIQPGISFTNQNPEARADIFSASVAANNFSEMNGFSHTANSQTRISVRDGVFRVTTVPTGSLVPRTVRIGSSTGGTSSSGTIKHTRKK